MFTRLIYFPVLILMLGSLVSCDRPGHKDLEYSFVTLGCNRLDKADTTSTTTSTANEEQLKRSFDEIAAMKPIPKYLFFTGDMVIGYAADTNKLAAELQAWLNIYEHSALAKTGIILVPMPGNHESLIHKGMGSTPAQERTWLRVMGKYALNDNGPKAGGKDDLETDNSRMNYSFDYNGDHFLVLNSDPCGSENTVPYCWIADDLKAARIKGCRHIFAFAHKPAYSAPEDDALDKKPVPRDSFWNAMEKYNADAMFAAHNHIYYRLQPHPGKTRMVIAGNGGSPLSDYAMKKKELQFFGYTKVDVYKDGAVILRSYGRPIPAAGYATSSVGTVTTVRDSADISLR
jgi:hypothetical protein